MSHDPIDALKFWGYSEREAAFSYLVATHSGFFLRRQFCEFVDRQRGSIATHFLRKATSHGLIRAMDVDGLHFVYHLCGKSLYRMLGNPDSQNRRVKSSGEILRRLMVLDYVLQHLGAEEFLETEEARHRYFVQAGADRDAVTRASSFREPVPVSIRHDAQRQVVRFAFVDEGQRSLSKFDRFLQTHKPLLSALPHAEVAYIARRPQHFQEAEHLFQRRFSNGKQAIAAGPLGVDHLIQWLTVNRKFHIEHRSITPAEHRLLQEGDAIYRDPIHVGLIASWNSGAINVDKIRKIFHTNAAQVHIQTELIRASYPKLLSLGAGHSTGHANDKKHGQIALFHNEIAKETGYE